MRAARVAISDVLAGICDVSGNISDALADIHDVSGNVSDALASICDVSGKISHGFVAIFNVSGRFSDALVDFRIERAERRWLLADRQQQGMWQRRPAPFHA